MQDPEIREMLLEFSKTTMDAGRKIGSIKNDPDDLRILAETLGILQEGVETTRRIWLRKLERGD